MVNFKFDILRRIRNTQPNQLLVRADFYKNAKQINEYKRAIDELIAVGYLCAKTGSDKLSITTKGIAAYEAELSRREHQQRENRRYGITTAIAVLALLVSMALLAVEILQHTLIK